MVSVLSNATLLYLSTGIQARRWSPHVTTISKANDRLFMFVNVITGISKIPPLASHERSQVATIFGNSLHISRTKNVLAGKELFHRNISLEKCFIYSVYGCNWTQWKVDKYLYITAI